MRCADGNGVGSIDGGGRHDGRRQQYWNGKEEDQTAKYELFHGESTAFFLSILGIGRDRILCFKSACPMPSDHFYRQDTHQTEDLNK